MLVITRGYYNHITEYHRFSIDYPILNFPSLSHLPRRLTYRNGFIDVDEVGDDAALGAGRGDGRRGSGSRVRSVPERRSFTRGEPELDAREKEMVDVGRVPYTILYPLVMTNSLLLKIAIDS